MGEVKSRAISRQTAPLLLPGNACWAGGNPNHPAALSDQPPQFAEPPGPVFAVSTRGWRQQGRVCRLHMRGSEPSAAPAQQREGLHGQQAPPHTLTFSTFAYFLISISFLPFSSNSTVLTASRAMLQARSDQRFMALVFIALLIILSIISLLLTSTGVLTGRKERTQHYPRARAVPSPRSPSPGPFYGHGSLQHHCWAAQSPTPLLSSSPQPARTRFSSEC